MTKKILFCLNADFTHFSIAYYLQQKLDCEFYALIDITNKPKKFFDSQQLVKFKKVWYFHDHIKKEKQIDTDYLQNLEVLWYFSTKIAHSLFSLDISFSSIFSPISSK